MAWNEVKDEDVPRVEFKNLKVIGDSVVGIFRAHETREDTYEGKPNNKETYTLEGLDGVLAKVDMPTDGHRKLEVARKRGLEVGHLIKVTITKMLLIEGREHPMKVCAIQWTSDAAEIERFRQEQKKRHHKAAAKPPQTRTSDFPDDPPF